MTANQPVINYAVDIAFVIDCTGSMAPGLNSVKQTARKFHSLLQASMAEKDKGIDQLRVRVVAFRDLGEEGPDAISATSFFDLPDDAAAYEHTLAGLEADGGGDEPESALEALAVAIRSPWERGRDKRRHVVVMCTDASAHPLGKFAMGSTGALGEVSGQGGGGGGGAMPASLEELQSIWGDESDEGEMEYAAKRLLLLAPASYPWSDLADTWENCIWVESAATKGLADHLMGEILDLVAGSI